jgi:hypothetical protein
VREDAAGCGRVSRGFSPYRESVLRSAGVSPHDGSRSSPGISALQGVLPLRLDATDAASPLLRFVAACRSRLFTGASGSQSAEWLAGLSRDCRPSWASCPRPGFRLHGGCGRLRARSLMAARFRSLDPILSESSLPLPGIEYRPMVATRRRISHLAAPAGFWPAQVSFRHPHSRGRFIVSVSPCALSA